MPYTDVNILNVGRGSCSVVESPSGRKSMIDINDGGELREAAGMSFAARFPPGSRDQLAEEQAGRPNCGVEQAVWDHTALAVHPLASGCRPHGRATADSQR